jgi:hypothetical protein
MMAFSFAEIRLDTHVRRDTCRIGDAPFLLGTIMGRLV